MQERGGAVIGKALEGAVGDASWLGLLPLSIEGIVAATLVAIGAFPAGASGATAAAVFPADVFFDLKQSLAFGRTWPWVVAVLCLSVLARSAVFTSSLWLAGGRRGSFAPAWFRMAGLTACAWVALVPAATMILSGTAIRYAPFLFVGAALGVAASTYLARHAFRQRGDAAGPDLSAWLGYAYLIAVTGLAREWMSGRAPVIVIALVIALTGPMHGLVLLRWSNSRRGKGPRGKAALVATILAVGAGLGDVAYDRYLNEIPRARETRDSHLYLLGGVDSTSKTGALTDLDVRALGWRPAQVIVLSYRGLDLPYTAVDTHQDLDDVARRVATQIELPLMPGDALLGHSQAGLIVDRMLAAHLPVPPRVAVMAPPPTDPPRMELPPPGSTGAGAPAADLDRALAAALDAIGAPTYDASVPASPVNLDPLAVPHAEVDRLAVWALGDSVWLDGDWRRTGEINVVSISDHVGAASDERAVEVVGRFFAGRSVEGDESSWRSLLVNAIRYTFEPWRP